MANASRGSRWIAGPITALVAEDDVELASVLADELLAMGYAARIVLDGETAMVALRDEDPAILLVDLGLPGRDGIEVAEASRRRGATFPIVGMTGWEDPEIHARAREAGCDLVLRKPFTVQELQQAVERARALPVVAD